jgi:hypothetical protein
MIDILQYPERITYLNIKLKKLCSFVVFEKALGIKNKFKMGFDSISRIL